LLEAAVGTATLAVGVDRGGVKFDGLRQVIDSAGVFPGRAEGEPPVVVRRGGLVPGAYGLGEVADRRAVVLHEITDAAPLEPGGGEPLPERDGPGGLVERQGVGTRGLGGATTGESGDGRG